jgi:hypothetical protein
MAHLLQERVEVVVGHLLMLVVLVVLQLLVEPLDLIQLPQTMEQQILVVVEVEFPLLVAVVELAAQVVQA